jgi:D-alanyl-D-alanine carboxypeptidase/D-alanyl-D-alanine-endopeptidase (penicillin-binding protein 4)
MGSFGRRSVFIGISKRKICLSIFCLCLCLEAKTPLDHATVSVYAVHVPTGKVLLSENSQKSLVPASTLKLVITVAALHLLGPESRFQTHLAYDGKIEEDILKGNLYIVGGGDPCLGSGRTSSCLSWQEQIKAWTVATAELGITEIEGKVISDSSSFEKAQAIPSWSWEDLGNYYGAGASALSFHENAYSLFFKPSHEVGKEAEVLKVEPAIDRLDLKNEVTTGPEGSGDQACIYGSEFSFLQHVRGTVPAGSLEFTIRGAIPDPALVCSDLLQRSLKENGIVLKNEVKPQLEKKVFHITYSPKVEEIAALTNLYSINLYAEHLLKKVGGGSSASGIKAVNKFLKEKGIDCSGLYLADGSGLSRKNLITTEQLVSLLVLMKKSEFFPAFLESLPDGKSVIKAKSGFMSGVQAYAGYANDVAFAIIINNCLDSECVKEKIDEFFEVISKK